MEVENTQDKLLALLHVCGEVEGITKLNKLVFLMWKECGISFEDIEFQVSNYGAYSVEILDKIEALINYKLVDYELVDTTFFAGMADEERVYDGAFEGRETGLKIKKYYLTDKGKKVAKQLSLSEEDAKAIEYVKENYNTMKYQRLMPYIHNTYPEFSIPMR